MPDHSSHRDFSLRGAICVSARRRATSTQLLPERRTMEPRRKAGPRPPAWLRWLSNDAARGIVADEFHAPIGCHFYQNPDNDEWEVSIFVSATEIVGGPLDGKNVPLQVQLDIVHVMNLFDETPTVHWQSDAVAEDDELAQHLSFEGTARGHRIWLRILKEPPEGMGPGRLLHAGSGEVETLW
ncbi:hypothetical protein Fuma_06391 [Fuerstiella marisgermanici]|uniref:Uncharacterized protein n=2 Tax=Fuerstiella marisgermanici TaxID=1891926 RepID=A0A1P8WRR0_9PLAN|nr:hypothetical protein Fuma_06391 [Fuerstiella marisgermanici]